MQQQVALQWSKLEHVMVRYATLLISCILLFVFFALFSARSKLRKQVSGLQQLLCSSQLGEGLGSTHPPIHLLTLSYSRARRLYHSLLEEQLETRLNQVKESTAATIVQKSWRKYRYLSTLYKTTAIIIMINSSYIPIRRCLSDLKPAGVAQGL